MQTPSPFSVLLKSAVWESLRNFQLCEGRGEGNIRKGVPTILSGIDLALTALGWLLWSTLIGNRTSKLKIVSRGSHRIRTNLLTFVVIGRNIMEQGYERESAFVYATKSGSRAKYKSTFQRKRNPKRIVECRVRSCISRIRLKFKACLQGPNNPPTRFGSWSTCRWIYCTEKWTPCKVTQWLYIGLMEMVATLTTDENSRFEGFVAFLLPQSTSHWLPDPFLNTPPPSGDRPNK